MYLFTNPRRDSLTAVSRGYSFGYDVRLEGLRGTSGHCADYVAVTSGPGLLFQPHLQRLGEDSRLMCVLH